MDSSFCAFAVIASVIVRVAIHKIHFFTPESIFQNSILGYGSPRLLCTARDDDERAFDLESTLWIALAIVSPRNDLEAWLSSSGILGVKLNQCKQASKGF